MNKRRPRKRAWQAPKKARDNRKPLAHLFGVQEDFEDIRSKRLNKILREDF